MPPRPGVANLIAFVAFTGLVESVERPPVIRRNDAPSTAPPPERPAASLEEGSNRLALKRHYPFYHSSAELRKEVRRLAGANGCPGALLTVRSVEDNGTKVDMINVKSSATATPANRVFLLTGEHARELIGPESMLYFLRALCGDGDAKFGVGKAATSLLEGAATLSAHDRASVLQNSEFGVIINANPKSRIKVERGSYCLRANPEGVDLNRNWDEHWEYQFQTNMGIGGSGPQAFSEPETRIASNLVKEFKPTTFLSVHSGTLGMYMPWAYSADSLATGNQASMLRVLEDLDKNHCQCPYGAAGKEVGYPCSGTSVDYVYDALKVPYAFAVEIWDGNGGEMNELKQRWKEDVREMGQQLLQGDAQRLRVRNLADPIFRDFFAVHPSDFVGMLQTGSARAGAEHRILDEDLSCMKLFNPTDLASYERTVQNWASAYADMSTHTALEIAKLGSGSVNKVPIQSAQRSPVGVVVSAQGRLSTES